MIAILKEAKTVVLTHTLLSMMSKVWPSVTVSPAFTSMCKIKLSVTSLLSYDDCDCDYYYY
jgi:hypothetical protein